MSGIWCHLSFVGTIGGAHVESHGDCKKCKRSSELRYMILYFRHISPAETERRTRMQRTVLLKFLSCA